MSIASLLLAFLAPAMRAKPDRKAELAGLKVDLADARRELADARASYTELARIFAATRDERNDLRHQLRALTTPYQPPRALIPDPPSDQIRMQLYRQMQALQTMQRPEGIPYPPPDPGLVSLADHMERICTCTPSRSDALRARYLVQMP